MLGAVQEPLIQQTSLVTVALYGTNRTAVYSDSAHHWTSLAIVDTPHTTYQLEA